MNLLLVPLLAAAMAAGNAPAENNTILKELTERGVPMPQGSPVKLPPLLLADGLNAAAQRQAITRAIQPDYDLDEFMRESPVAPLALSIRAVPVAGSEAPARSLDCCFVVYGDFQVLTSDKFLDGLVKIGERSPEGSLTGTGILDDAELARHHIRLQRAEGLEERVYGVTFTLFDRVEVRATRNVVITRAPGSVILAGKIDRRFDGDGERPNQWRAIITEENGATRLGPPHPYANAGFYVKATQLAQPAGASFVEYHMVFDEPSGWFDGANLLRSKLPLVIQDQVRTLRRKLVAATK